MRRVIERRVVQGCDARDSDVLEVGARLHLEGQYRLIRRIGSGGFGSVYEALDIRLGRAVAIKVPEGELGAACLVREAQALSVVNHPGLVQVYSLGSLEGQPYMVMELLRGTLLADLLDIRYEEGRGRLPLATALEVIHAIAETLIVVHASGFAHRDIKAENIVLSPRRVVLVDLGLAMPEYEARPGLPISGTPEYIAPEIALNQLERGRAHLTDIYALGVLAFRLLADRYPFESPAGPVATLAQHLSVQRPSLREERPGLPPDLIDLVDQMLAYAPDDRPSSIEVVAWVLRRLTAQAQSIAPPPPPAARLRHPRR